MKDLKLKEKELLAAIKPSGKILRKREEAARKAKGENGG